MDYRYSEDAIIRVSVWVGKQGDSVVVLGEPDAIDISEFEDVMDEVELVWMDFRRPGFVLENEMISNCLASSKGGAPYLNIAKLRSMRINLLLVDWSFTDDNGQKIPPGLSELSNMPPNVIFALMGLLEARLNPKPPTVAESPSEGSESQETAL